MIEPLISIIVPTKNSELFLKQCLRSIKSQTYKNFEIIVVDNYSTDRTYEIARKYTKLVFRQGPERSAQRNFGANKSRGEYVLFIDSDMELSVDVVKHCAQQVEDYVGQKKLGGIIIPEKSTGVGFWAKCKALERSFYVGVDWIEAARFFPKDIFIKVNGFDEKLTSGEDWDLSQRIRNKYALARIGSFIYHNEGKLMLSETIRKKYYYAKKISPYLKKNSSKNNRDKQMSIIKRYKLFFSNPKKLFSDPAVGIGMLFMKTTEFGVGGIGYLLK